MKVLVVEDEPTSRLALEITLKKWSYDVVVSKNGTEAWKILQHPDSPRLIILDWLMPGMDGIQLCRKIRNSENTDTDYVYIIMLTVKRRKEDVLACLDAGANDYIVKPFQKEVLRAGVATGARRVIASHNALCEITAAEKKAVMQRYVAQMRQLVDEQAIQQLHIDRMATVGMMSAGIAHEINNPTSYVLGSAKNLRLFWEEIEPMLEKHPAETENEQKALEFILARTQANIDAICSGVERILNITDGLKAFSHMGNAQRDACDINMCVLHSLEFCHNVLKNNIKVQKSLTRSLPKVTADGLQIEQVLINLIVNASDAMEQQPEGILSIRTRTKGNKVIITVADTGTGIPESDLDNIWQPFFTTKPVGKGTGLGLATVRKIIDSHSGKISVKNKPRRGVEFTITLPTAQPPEP